MDRAAHPDSSDQRPDLATVRSNYQVENDKVITYHPHLGGFLPIPIHGKKLTQTEGALLNDMTRERGIDGLMDLESISGKAAFTAASRYPDQALPDDLDPSRVREWQGNDGHRDAFRHAYWNAMMAREFGQDWAKAFATAHEGLPGNSANREAMDLYNNEIGRKIAAEHPKASRDELAGFVDAAVKQGRMVVVDKDGSLQWSDRVLVGRHGLAPPEEIQPHLTTPKPVSPDARNSSDLSAIGVGEHSPDPAHGRTADHHDYSQRALYRDVSSKVEALQSQLGMLSGQELAQMKASLTVLAASNGLERVDYVVASCEAGRTTAGQQVFVVQGDPRDPAHLRANMPTDQALATSEQVSFQQLAQLDQQRVAARTTEAPAQQQEVPSHGARALG